jgi:hypothetical protein
MSRSSTRALARVGVVVALAVTGLGVRSAFAASPSAASSVVTVDPARILDTRSGLGVGNAGPLDGGSTVSVQVTGVGGVPADATGVVVTLTATEATASSFVAAWPSGQPQPSTSVLNFTAGEDIANTVTMAIGAGGKIDLFNSAGSVQLLADVTGYLVPAGTGGGAPGGPTTHSVEYTAYGAMANGFAGQFGDYGCIRVGGNAGQAGDVELDLDLPHGAVITSVDFRYFDNDQANFQMGLTGSSGGFPGTPAPVGLVDAQTQSTGAVGYLTASITPTGVQPVSSTVRYWLVAVSLGVQVNGNAHRFCGATVTYTLP